MTVISYRLIKFMKIPFVQALEDTEFDDSNLISDYALEAVKEMKSAEIVSGIGEGIFDPKGKVTRAQAAVMIDRLLTKVEGKISA